MSKFEFRVLLASLSVSILFSVVINIIIVHHQTESAALQDNLKYLEGIILDKSDENVINARKNEEVVAQNKELTVTIFLLRQRISAMDNEYEKLTNENFELRDRLKKTPMGYVAWEGKKLNYNEYEILQLIKIIFAESEFRIDAVNDTSGEKCIGFAQIKEGQGYDTASLYTLSGNISAMFDLYKKYGTKPWNSSKSQWNG